MKDGVQALREKGRREKHQTTTFTAEDGSRQEVDGSVALFHC